MNATAPNWAFYALHIVGIWVFVSAAVFAVQYALRIPTWGPWLVAINFAAMALNLLDQSLLRWLWRGDQEHIYGGNGWLTWAVRAAWIGSSVLMLIASRRGGLLRDV